MNDVQAKLDEQAEIVGLQNDVHRLRYLLGAEVLAHSLTASELALLREVADRADELLDEDRCSWSDYHTALTGALEAWREMKEKQVVSGADVGTGERT